MNMRERIARALAVFYEGQKRGETMVEDYLPEADAVLEAMREPDDAMIEASGDVDNGCVTIWLNMIDAARNGA